MNNWRLLLLAVVAVFQPIASFTDSNLIDGRQQCCDRLSSAPLQDSLHGTYRLGKTTSALRRLNDRDETREDRRYELRQRVSVLSRSSSERPLVDIRRRIASQSPSEAKASRVEFRLERPVISQSRNRLLDINQREETARSNRDKQTQDLTRRVVGRTPRDALDRRNVGTFTKSPRDNLFRNDYRTDSFGNERLSKNLFDVQREMQREDRSVERKITLNRDARRVFSRTQDDAPSIEASNNMKNQRIARERLSSVRRESLIRPDMRRNSERNDERRDLQRINEQRRSLTENTRLVHRIRDMRITLNAREDNRENRHRESSIQRRSTERFEGHREQREDRSSKQQNKENIGSTASSNERRMQVNRRIITRESRTINVMASQNDRNADVQQEIRYNEKTSRGIQDVIRENPAPRLSRERILMDRRNIRESRNMNAQTKGEVDDSRREIRHNERLTKETRDGNRENREEGLSRERIQMDRRNIRGSRIINAQNKREVDGRREIRNNERLIRDTRNEGLSRERIQIDRRNIRESRIINGQNKREVNGQPEIRHGERLTRETRDENTVNPNYGLSLERIQIERRNTREFRTVGTTNDKEINSRREIRFNEMSPELRKEARPNPEQIIFRERIQMDQRNFGEFRSMNIVIRTKRNADNRMEMRTDGMLHSENRENREHRISYERIQMDRRNNREARIGNEKSLRLRDRELTRETREQLKENPDRRHGQESRQVDLPIIRDSRVNSVDSRTERSPDTKNRRDIRKNERLYELRNDQFTPERRVQSRSSDRVNAEERDSVIMYRKVRTADRRNFREIRAEPRLSRSADLESRSEVFRSRVAHSHKVENKERDAIDARSRNLDISRNRERISSVMVGKVEIENEYTIANWQYVLYTLQTAYLCALFMQMLKPSRTEKASKMYVF